MRSFISRAQLAAALALLALILGCETKQLDPTQSHSTPPPNLASRPWGISQLLVQLAESENSDELKEYLAHPDEAEQIAQKLRGLSLEREAVSPEEAKVWLKNEDSQSVGYLLFKKRIRGWTVEEYVPEKKS